MDILVETRAAAAPLVHLTFEPDEPLDAVIDAVVLAENAGTEAEIWLHGTTPERRAYFESTNRRTDRTLLQMRCPLPTPRSTVSTRAFTEADLQDFITVNNRAFAWHPEQSGLTEADVRSDMGTPWFQADGFRLHHDVDGRLAGFCWTKVHTEPEPLGEIYVIAVDPDFHGQGKGRQLTLAGLDWLHAAGLSTGMLYVESDNTAAVKTYERIGFHTHRTDTLWRPGGDDRQDQ